MKRLLALVVIAVLAFTAISTAAPRRGGTLRVGLNADPPNMDPHQSTAAVDRQVFQNLYDKLVDINENLEIVPMLATSWTITEGGRVYTFKLRPNVVFHDGTPFNAEAVKANFDRMLDRSFGSPRFSEVNLVTKVEVVDPLTVRITLEKPYSPFLAVLSDRAGMMVSPAAAQRLGKGLAREPVGTGPYRFVEKRPQERIVLERFDRHWDRGAGNVQQIVYRPFTDENARLANLRAGELDIIDQVAPAEIPKLKTDPVLRLFARSGLGWQGMWIQVQSGIFSNKALRQALNAAIDRRTLVQVVFGETADPANGPFPPGMFTYSIPANSRIPERNLDLARQKLREGGQPNGFAFTLKVTPGRVPQQVAQVIQSMAGEVGIRVNIEIVEFGALLSQLDAHRFEASLLGWSGRPDPDGNIYGFFVTGGGLNNSAYSNPRVDALLDAARILTTPDQRRRAYTEVMNVLNDDLPYLFLWWPKEYKVLGPKLQGFVHISDGMMRFRNVWLNP
ncbi:MAG: ABC transporter substrate-binding protein [Armatimonadota bacterium]|nr:ABC transporter substrate-binding protein [Armatimonadota bacterium]MDR7450679.1 ABC transporter substrate-binding protein [Armatimonadota bacterium]MDR7466035.1 ABC transporter substrate-binding protein [Armatimonadota bacterium]MDR7493928.1 ABC transporter substrate-binding protein [Armatimonadota bacterium]MDR7504033.1 ABC transporter substrate-binding protein [Armatimonadota bacterium]